MAHELRKAIIVSGGSIDTVLDLYAVSCDRDAVLMLVIASSRGGAVQFCRDAGLGWHFQNTMTRKIQRNVEGDEGVLNAIEMRCDKSSTT